MTDAATLDELRLGFDAFIAAARRLEQSHAELKARAAAIGLELQATNARLQRALAERDMILAALPHGVLAIRGDGSVAFRNDEAARLSALGHACGVDLAAVPTGEIALGEGAVRVFRSALPDGELVLLEDRSRLRELEREVHRLDRLAGLSELALGVAHEIKNPLNGAMGFAALLDRASDAATARRYAQRVHEALQQVDEIVRSLLAFARPGHRDGERQPVHRLIAEAAAAAELPLGRIAQGGELDIEVEADALRRVLSVLFRNAREAAGDEVTVRVAARRIGSRLELMVEDDGPGVPPGLGARVFEPFVSSKERGTGLGLPLAARVLAFLGGEIALVDPERPGARFCVRVPLSAPAEVLA